MTITNDRQEKAPGPTDCAPQVIRPYRKSASGTHRFLLVGHHDAPALGSIPSVIYDLHNVKLS